MGPVAQPFRGPRVCDPRHLPHHLARPTGLTRLGLAMARRLSPGACGFAVRDPSLAGRRAVALGPSQVPRVAAVAPGTLGMSRKFYPLLDQANRADRTNRCRAVPAIWRGGPRPGR